TLLDQIGSAIGGFVSWVGGALKGIGETLWDFATNPIGSLQKTWDWVSTHQHETIDIMIGVATVAVLVASIIITGGFGAGFVIPAMIALDVATIANIFSKVAISKQPLDTFDLITIGLVGFANAGAIARVLRPALKPTSPLLKIQGELDANIARLGENAAARTKIREGIGRLKPKNTIELPENIKEFRAIGTESVDWASRKAKRIAELKGTTPEQIKIDLDKLATAVEGKHGIEVPRLDIDYKDLDKIYAVERILGQYRSTENIRTMLRSMGTKFDSVTKISFVEMIPKERLVAAYNKKTGEIVINLSNAKKFTADKLFFAVHHEAMHSANEIELVTGEIVKVKNLVDSAADKGGFAGRYVKQTENDYVDIGKNQLEDIINYKLMKKADPQRAKFYEDTYKKFISSRDEIKLIDDLVKKPNLSPEDIAKLKKMLDPKENPYGHPVTAEWLAVTKGDDATKEFLKTLIQKAPDLEPQLTEINSLREPYKEVMKIV
ncbi:MAG TPA: hypothetical protein VJB06_01735, partial [archaeon]|nr:hypothetical protein [archaeon]